MGETDESSGPIISRMHSLCMAVKAVNDGGDFDGDIKPGSPVVSPGGVWRWLLFKDHWVQNYYNEATSKYKILFTGTVACQRLYT